MAGFEFRQCERDACRFRFPTELDREKTIRCPRCGTATMAAGQPAQASAVPEPELPGASFAALLDNIRSIHNVGSIFRTADGVGIEHLFLCGITTTPAHPKLVKAALGAQEFVPWSHHLNGLDLAHELKGEGRQIWAVETGKGSEDLFSADHQAGLEPVVLVFGNERAGIDPGILAQCDRILYLPMAGEKRSLNVAVAFGITSYFLRNIHEKGESDI